MKTPERRHRVAKQAPFSIRQARMLLNEFSLDIENGTGMNLDELADAEGISTGRTRDFIGSNRSHFSSLAKRRGLAVPIQKSEPT